MPGSSGPSSVSRRVSWPISTTGRGAIRKRRLPPGTALERTPPMRSSTTPCPGLSRPRGASGEAVDARRAAIRHGESEHLRAMGLAGGDPTGAWRHRPGVGFPGFSPPQGRFPAGNAARSTVFWWIGGLGAPHRRRNGESARILQNPRPGMPSGARQTQGSNHLKCHE